MLSTPINYWGWTTMCAPKSQWLPAGLGKSNPQSHRVSPCRTKMTEAFLLDWEQRSNYLQRARASVLHGHDASVIMRSCGFHAVGLSWWAGRSIACTVRIRGLFLCTLNKDLYPLAIPIQFQIGIVWFFYWHAEAVCFSCSLTTACDGGSGCLTALLPCADG